MRLGRKGAPETDKPLEWGEARALCTLGGLEHTESCMQPWGPVPCTLLLPRQSTKKPKLRGEIEGSSE